MPIASIVTRGYGTYSTVNLVPVRGYGVTSTNLTLSTAAWHWNSQALLLNQRTSKTLTVVTWNWNAFPLIIEQAQQFSVTSVTWAWNAFALGINGLVKKWLSLMGCGT